MKVSASAMFGGRVTSGCRTGGIDGSYYYNRLRNVGWRVIEGRYGFRNVRECLKRRMCSGKGGAHIILLRSMSRAEV